MKACPYCAEEVQDAAVKCRHCGELLGRGAALPVPSEQESDAVVVAMANKKASRALKEGIFGLFCFGVVLGPMAISRGRTANKLLRSVGQPPSRRATAAVVIGSLATALWAVSLLLQVPAVKARFLGTTLDLSAQPVAEVRGQQVPYRLTLPAGWYRRDTASARAQNPIAEHWAVRPDLDAHLLVIPEIVPADAKVNMDALADAVLGHLKKSSVTYQEIARAPIAGRPNALLIESQATVAPAGLLHYYHGLFVAEPYVVQVVAFANPLSWHTVQADLRASIDSLALQGATAAAPAKAAR